MPTMGYCHDCGRWVSVAGDGSCPQGHPASRVNGWYESETGRPVSPPAPSGAAGAAAVPPGGTRAGFLAELATVLEAQHGYRTIWGGDTDLTMTSNPVDARWGAGHKRAEYAAALKVDEAAHVIHFWEMLKERSHGMTFGTFESEHYTTRGATRSGAKQEATIGPGSASWEFGYGTLRKLVEDVAARHGFTVRVVLNRRGAVW